MKGLFALAMLSVVLVSLSGCAQTGGPAEQDAGGGAPRNLTAQNALNASTPSGTQAGGYREYRQDTFSFDYPDTLQAQESLGSYMGGRGYAFVALQNEDADDPALLVYYIRFGNISLMAGKSAGEISRGFLESDNSGQDMMGVLHQSSDESGITQSTTKNGYAAAEMTYVLRDPESTQELYGYAIQIYDPETTVSMKARILGMDKAKVDAARSRFMESVKITDLPE